jgi:hypothetical protein
MPRFRLMIGICFLLLFILTLSACQTDQPVLPTQTPTTLPSNTQVPPTVTATETPTSTPSATPTATPSPTPTLTPTPVAYGPNNFPVDINPLTGLKVSDPTLLNRRPVMVKVSNFPREGRPHSGLSLADIVFEYYIGEGSNRFLALYYGQDAPKVGPMRSARLVDTQIVRQYQGILAFVSADVNVVWPAIWTNLGNRAITSSPSTCPAICSVGQQTVISVFGDTAKITEWAVRNLGIARQKPNLEGLAFNSSVPQSGLLAKSITVKYNPVNINEWRYDEVSGKYLLWMESVNPANFVTMVPMPDSITNKQVAFSNIIIVSAYYTEYAPTLHEVNMWFNRKGLKAVLFRDGKAVEGTWKSNGTDSPIQFFTMDGQPMPLKPGNTWMVIAGVNSKLDQPVLANWQMQFYLP